MARCIEVHEAVMTTCTWLGGSREHCSKLAREAQRAGILCIYDAGPIEVKGLHILGKGWAGFVAAALHRRGPVTVKFLKPGGRRVSLLAEAAAYLAAGVVGVAPRLYAATRRVLVMQLVDGPSLSRYEPRSLTEALRVLTRLLYKAYMLDMIGLRHNELARPGGQVLIARTRDEPFIIDYESATWSTGRTAANLTQLLGGLPRTPLGRRCGIENSLKRIRTYLRLYKRGDTGKAYINLQRSVAIGCVDAWWQ